MRNTVVECDVSGAEPGVQILGTVNHATPMLLAGVVAMLVLLNYQCVCPSVRVNSWATVLSTFVQLYIGSLYRGWSNSVRIFKIAHDLRRLLGGVLTASRRERHNERKCSCSL